MTEPLQVPASAAFPDLTFESDSLRATREDDGTVLIEAMRGNDVRTITKLDGAVAADLGWLLQAWAGQVSGGEDGASGGASGGSVAGDVAPSGPVTFTPHVDTPQS